MAWSFIGGIGYLLGPLFGATLAPGSLGAQLTNTILDSITQYIQLIGGVIVVLLVLQNQDGIAKESTNQFLWLAGKVRAKIPRLPRAKAETFELPPEERERVAPRTLDVRGLGVRYGGVVAVRDVSFTVTPGRITGLIGPNGAGKTSVIDAITGFTRTSTGSVLLDGQELVGLSATKRARAGLSRSFQSLELFEDATVLDNLRAASDPRDRMVVRSATSCTRSAPPLPGEVVAADPRVPPGGRPAARRPGPALRAAAPPRHRPRRRHPAERAAARRAGRRAERRRDGRAGPPRAPPGRRLGHRASCSSSTT